MRVSTEFRLAVLAKAIFALAFLLGLWAFFFVILGFAAALSWYLLQAGWEMIYP